MERYPNGMTIAALPFQLRPGRPDDALAILEAQRSAIRQTAASAYSTAIIDEWAPDVIVRERVDTFRRWIERGEELIVVATEPAGEIIGFGSIVPAKSELRAVYVDAAYGGERLYFTRTRRARHVLWRSHGLCTNAESPPFITSRSMRVQQIVCLACGNLSPMFDEPTVAQRSARWARPHAAQRGR
jgi:hypothetical protein